jgi:uncharacterized SAM-binding protein YcdF (DUF218 family)
MVLSGGQETRPFAAADLYRQRIANRILITSVGGNQRQTDLPESHEVFRTILLHCGVPESDIEFIDSRCRSTFDEAKTLKTFLSTHPVATVSVVTSEYHTRRSRWVFGNVLGPSISQVHFVSARSDDFNASSWWRNEEGFVAYLSEYFKLSFYWVRYGHGLAWIAAVAGLIGLGWWISQRRSKTSPA